MRNLIVPIAVILFGTIQLLVLAELHKHVQDQEVMCYCPDGTAIDPLEGMHPEPLPTIEGM